MKLFKHNVSTLLVSLLSSLNQRQLSQIEVLVKRAQGKGNGSESVGLEIKQALEFLPVLKRQKPTILDVVANVGQYASSVLELRPGAKIYCFEPSTNAVSRLLEKFQLDDRVTVVPTAIGSRNQQRTLYSDSSGSVLASLYKRRLDHFDIDFSFEEIVPVTTLDDWNRDLSIEPDIIKIDVEGNEFEVLMGGPEILQKTCVVQFEFGGSNVDSRTYWQDFLLLS